MIKSRLRDNTTRAETHHMSCQQHVVLYILHNVILTCSTDTTEYDGNVADVTWPLIPTFEITDCLNVDPLKICQHLPGVKSSELLHTHSEVQTSVSYVMKYEEETENRPNV